MDSDLYLQARWPRTRRRLLSLIKAAVPVLSLDTSLDKGAPLTDEQWAAFVADVVTTLRDGQTANPPTSQTYALLEACLDVFQNAHVLRELFEKNATALQGGNMGVVHTLSSRALSKMRDIALPGSLHHRRVWSGYDQISRDIVGDRSGYNRCQTEHFEAVAERVAQRHAHDHNLSAKVDYVTSIFHEFCPDCRESLDQVDQQGRAMGETLADETVEAFDAVVDKQVLISVLMTCLSKLDRPIADIVRHNYGFEGSGEESVSEFCRQHKIGRTTYHERKAKAERLLGACLAENAGSADTVIGLFK